jgi:hypothetical protein
MIRLAQQAAEMAVAAIGRELASQLGITQGGVEWAMSAFAVKIGPLMGSVTTRKSNGCTGCTA